MFGAVLIQDVLDIHQHVGFDYILWRQHNIWECCGDLVPSFTNWEIVRTLCACQPRKVTDSTHLNVVASIHKGADQSYQWKARFARTYASSTTLKSTQVHTDISTHIHTPTHTRTHTDPNTHIHKCSCQYTTYHKIKQWQGGALAT